MGASIGNAKKARNAKSGRGCKRVKQDAIESLKHVTRDLTA